MVDETKQIVILGAGYSGMMAALRLAGKTKRLATNITLVNGLDHFVERPRLHEHATGIALKQKRLIDMLRGTKVNFVQGWVKRIDPKQQMVDIETANGQQSLLYHKLIYALGSQTNRDIVPGVAEYTFSLDPCGDLTATALKAKLEAVRQTPQRVIVVGGGATGLEAATQIKGIYPHHQVAIVTQGEAGAFKGPHIQKHILAALQEQNIEIYEQKQVTHVETDGVVLTSGKVEADIIIWSGGFQASPLAQQAGIPVNSKQQVLVDPYLRSQSYPNIYAVGDAAQPVAEPGAPIRMSLFTALVSGAQVADNIAADLKGKLPRPLSFAWYGQGIALGPNDAVGFGTYPVDQAWRLVFRRGLAVRVRNFFVWYLGFVLEMERRFPGFFYWNGKGRYQRQQGNKVTETQGSKVAG